ncbi:MAG: UDP binding domain-containing protein, partial [Actinomycetota bacterium]
EINGAMPDYVSSRLIDLAKPAPGSYLAILGVAYKSGISDIRESPAEDVARSLQNQGFKVLWSDPLVKSFHDYQKLTDQNLAGAIVVTAQEGLAVAEIAKSGVPILDCTGAYKAVKGVEQL